MAFSENSGGGVGGGIDSSDSVSGFSICSLRRDLWELEGSSFYYCGSLGSTIGAFGLITGLVTPIVATVRFFM